MLISALNSSGLLEDTSCSSAKVVLAAAGFAAPEQAVHGKEG
jgi:hypothetical protein